MKAQDDGAFPTTHWTLVARLRSGNSEIARRALEELVAQYRYTLYVYIRRRGFSHEDAEDALHDFLLKLLRIHAFEDADAARGRLRGFLGTALGRFLMHWRRDEARRPDAVTGSAPWETSGGVSAENEARYEKERFSEEDTPERIFDRKWGHALMARVLARLSAQCAERGKAPVFSALHPVLLSGGSLAGHNVAAIAASLGMSEGALRVTLSRHLRDYRVILEDEVLQTVEGPGDVADEIAHLMSVFVSG